MPIKSKAPAERLDWTEDWTEWLGSDTITASSWEIDPPGSLTFEDPSYSTTKTKVFLVDGFIDKIYRVVNRVETAAEKVGVRELYLLVEAK